MDLSARALTLTPPLTLTESEVLLQLGGCALTYLRFRPSHLRPLTLLRTGGLWNTLAARRALPTRLLLWIGERCLNLSPDSHELIRSPGPPLPRRIVPASRRRLVHECIQSMIRDLVLAPPRLKVTRYLFACVWPYDDGTTDVAPAFCVPGPLHLPRSNSGHSGPQHGLRLNGGHSRVPIRAAPATY